MCGECVGVGGGAGEAQVRRRKRGRVGVRVRAAALQEACGRGGPLRDQGALRSSALPLSEAHGTARSEAPEGVRLRAGNPKGIWVRERRAEHLPPPKAQLFLNPSLPKRHSAFIWPPLLSFMSRTRKTGTLRWKFCPVWERIRLPPRPEPLPAGTGRVPPTFSLGWGGNPEVGAKPDPQFVAAPAASQGMLSGQNRFSGLEIGSFCTTHPHSSSNYLSQTRDPLVPGRKSHTPSCSSIGYRQGFTSLGGFIG